MFNKIILLAYLSECEIVYATCRFGRHSLGVTDTTVVLNMETIERLRRRRAVSEYEYKRFKLLHSLNVGAHYTLWYDKCALISSRKVQLKRERYTGLE